MFQSKVLSLKVSLPLISQSTPLNLSSLAPPPGRRVDTKKEKTTDIFIFDFFFSYKIYKKKSGCFDNFASINLDCPN